MIALIWLLLEIVCHVQKTYHHKVLTLYRQDKHQDFEEQQIKMFQQKVLKMHMWSNHISSFQWNGTILMSQEDRTGRAALLKRLWRVSGGEVLRMLCSKFYIRKGGPLAVINRVSITPLLCRVITTKLLHDFCWPRRRCPPYLAPAFLKESFQKIISYAKVVGGVNYVIRAAGS